MQSKFLPGRARTLLEIALQRRQSSRDRIRGHRISKAYMPLTLRSEHNAGNRRHMRLFQQQRRHLATVLMNAGHIWKRVKRALWGLALQSALAQSCHEQVSFNA